jgi:hypothetical protein
VKGLSEIIPLPEPEAKGPDLSILDARRFDFDNPHRNPSRYSSWPVRASRLREIWSLCRAK